MYFFNRLPGYRYLFLGRQRFRQRELQDVLYPAQFHPIARRPIIILQAPIDGAIQAYDLVFVQEGPGFLVQRPPLCIAEAFLTELFNELVYWGA